MDDVALQVQPAAVPEPAAVPKDERSQPIAEGTVTLAAEVRADLEELKAEACRKAVSRHRKGGRWRSFYYVSVISVALTTFLGAGALLIDSGLDNTQAALIVLGVGGISTAMSAIDPWSRMVANYYSEAAWSRHARDITAAKRKQDPDELEEAFARLSGVTEDHIRSDAAARVSKE